MRALLIVTVLLAGCATGPCLVSAPGDAYIEQTEEGPKVERVPTWSASGYAGCGPYYAGAYPTGYYVPYPYAYTPFFSRFTVRAGPVHRPHATAQARPAARAHAHGSSGGRSRGKR